MTKKLSILVLSILIALGATQAQTYFGDQLIISETGDLNNAYSVFSADLDGDGDQDVLSASALDDKIAWYENTDGNGTFGAQQIISVDVDFATSVYSVDIDGDGDMDVLSASYMDDKIAWYENTDGNGTFGTQQIITTNADGARSVFSADLDGDGDMDVLSASTIDDRIAWYENTDGNGTFGAQQTITIAARTTYSVYSDDIDGDGDMDVLAASSADDTVFWFENTDGEGTFGSLQYITYVANSAMSVFTADIDGDDDVDVLSASSLDNKIAWYENTDGNGTFGTEQIISTEAEGARSVFSADLDGDGDMDVLSASYNDDKIAWYENTDGNGTFGMQQIISIAADGANSVYSADVDGDGDLDVLSSSGFGDEVSWYENYTANIVVQPVDKNLCPNYPTSFSVSAQDIDSYQWEINTGSGFSNLADNTVYSGTTTNTLTISNAAIGMDGFVYRCVITNTAGSLNSNEAALTVEDNSNPAITSSHNDQIIDANANCEVILPDYTGSVIVTDNCDNTYQILSDMNVEDFEDCSNLTWHTYDVSDNSDFWICGNGYMDINGYGGGADEDWLILSTPINFDEYTGEELAFRTQERYEGPNLEIYFSSNYSGSGTPVGSTWNSIPYTAVESSTNSEFSDWADNNIDLSSLTGTSYIAFKYTADGSNGGSENWRVDDIHITGYTNSSSLNVTQSPAAGTTISGATNEITLTAEDGAGNTDQVSFNIAVEDNTNPVISSAHNDQIVNVDENCQANLPDYTVNVTANDNCDTNLDISQSPVAGTTVSGATNPVTLTVTDDAGNYSEVSFNAAVEDNTNPVISSTHNDMTYGDGIACDYILPDYTGDVTATDNCDTNLDISQSPAAGTSISGATNEITLTVTDDAGNTAEVTFNAEVIDNTDPEILCIGNQTVTADETHYYTVQGTEFDPTETSDNCGISSIENDFNNQATLENAQLPEETTTIIWTITDNAGNENTCSFDVTVNAYVSVETLQQKGISIYPNPTNGIINFEFTDNNIQKLTISDITGKQIINKTEIQQNEMIDLSGFESGIYIITIQTDKEIFTTKIIKE